MKQLTAFLVALLAAVAAEAKIDLVTLPERDSVQLTIYNSADLTLVRENRLLTLEKGLNRLQFSWANTLIDPTSLEMIPRARADRIDVFGLAYPPRTRNLGLWQIQSTVSGKAPVEINYLTSGLAWRAFYLGTLSADEKLMDLAGYVRVTNNSGEDYQNAQIRLIVGRINVLDDIARLADRAYPYGRPPDVQPGAMETRSKRAKKIFERLDAAVAPKQAAAKQIVKEGISEYFLYAIEGTETIPSGWSKRLPSFQAAALPVTHLYKYDEARFGGTVVRFLRFANDKEHHLGQTPLPGGILKVFRRLDAQRHLAYTAETRFKYIPVGEKIELDLGPVEDVLISPTLMKFASSDHLFDAEGNVSGWNEIRTFTVAVKNTRSIPVAVEVRRHFHSPVWELTTDLAAAQYRKIDLDSVEFRLDLAGAAIREFSYTVTTRHGTRAER